MCLFWTSSSPASSMRLKTALAAACLLLSAFSNCSILTPPVLPLLVRNPYLSTWLGNAREVPWSKWPMFWTGQEIGFSVLASVPESSQVYPLLGRPQDSLLPVQQGDGYNVSFPTYLGAKYDASTTNLSYSIPSPNSSSKPAKLVLSFLSPITPSSTLRQSLPAAYITVFVEGTFNVNIYIDVNGQWVSGDRGSQIAWELSQSSFGQGKPGLKTWAFHRQTELLFTEYLDRAEWGTAHFSAPADVRHDSGTSALLRQRFSRTGTLQNENDNNFRSIMDDEPVFAFSKSFILNNTSIGLQSTDSVTFTMAHTQDPAVQFAAARGLTLMRPLWASSFSTEQLLIFHYLDFETASTLAYNYSAQLAIDAYQSGAADYVDIVALSARQVMGSTSFTGTPDDPIIFMKEISSDGNTQTIDVLFPSFPFFLYSNPKWFAYLLEPLIEHTLSGQYPNKYAMHDLGASFPNATGHPDGRDEYMPVEECGNILIMGLALVNSFRYKDKHAGGSLHLFDDPSEETAPSLDGPKAFTLQFKGGSAVKYLDTEESDLEGMRITKKWVNRSYGLWKQWTGYLVDYSLEPENQLSTDDFAGWLPLQTNLALKGIIGIHAMSKLAEIVGNDADAKMYRNISKSYIARWEETGLSRDKTHAKVAYDWYGSWTTLYNLYADSLLCFRVEPEKPKDTNFDLGPPHKQKPMKPPQDDEQIAFVPKHVYKLQSDWYYNVRQKYGLPLDSRHLYTKTDWEFFAMAVSARTVREPILQSVARWVNETVTDRPLTDLHMTEGRGEFPGPNFFARPVVGGHFAFLALERACGGKAVDGLKFLDETPDSVPLLDVQGLLRIDALEGLEVDAWEDL
ncbi:hypothetical protein EPUS_07520 [Endocarpon pusillum Z07020]|uniref:Glutaminase n=1 Tax=Endocarpon pusillum (strain Z07020 / HMAS-L-300199) TaxID=1263415 RepID=U1GNS6_ENDPU|nr:uncharacterized protein EPUS_07520 [Endocarpon pusillum Z07020]ERF73586.1 hypothetical protein EPUS_07520 [Endocarpon pusillum Z07020]